MNKKYNIFIFLLAIMIPYFHEISHYFGYQLDSIPATIQYGFTYTPPNSNSFWGIIFGPLFNIILSIIALIISYINSKKALVWNIISLSSAISRLLNILIILFTSIFNHSIVLNNDEGQIANLFNWSPYAIYLLSILIYIFVIIKIVKNKEYIKLSTKILFSSLLVSIFLIF